MFHIRRRTREILVLEFLKEGNIFCSLPSWESKEEKKRKKGGFFRGTGHLCRSSSQMKKRAFASNSILRKVHYWRMGVIRSDITTLSALHNLFTACGTSREGIECEIVFMFQYLVRQTTWRRGYITKRD